MPRPRFSKDNPLPPMFRCRRSPNTSQADKSFEHLTDEEKKESRLLEIVSNIYRKKGLQPDSIAAGSDTSMINNPNKSFDNDVTNWTFGSTVLIEEEFYRRKNFDVDFEACPDDSHYKLVQREIQKLEEGSRLCAEKSIRNKIEEFKNFNKNQWESSVTKLEKRLSEVHLIHAAQLKDLETGQDYQTEQKRALEIEIELKEKESQARIAAILAASLASAAKKQEQQKQSIERQKQEKEILQEERQKEELKENLMQELRAGLSNLTKLLEVAKNVLDLNFVDQILTIKNVNLQSISDLSKGVGFETDEAQQALSRVGEASRILEGQLHEVKEQRKRREKEDQDRAQIEAEKIAVEAQQQQVQHQQQQQQEQHHAKEGQNEIVSLTSQTGVPTTDDVSQENLQRYTQLMNYKSEFEIGLQPLTKDENWKAFASSCRRSVNHFCNLLGRATSSHLTEKLNQLSSLLRGEVVTISDEQFSAAQHPLGTAYCKSFLAVKLLKVGQEVVRAQPKDAFIVAAIMTSLWAEFPDFGELFLANLYQVCPFLVPCHFGRTPDMSPEDHLKKWGYHIDGQNAVEDQLMYEGRINGVARLYAAITITTLPKDKMKAKHDHPHGIGNAWRWLASCLNLKPVSGITSTIMLNILEVCGNELFAKYKSHFLHLLSLIAGEYLPHLEPISIPSRWNSLKDLVHKAIETRNIKKPEGILMQGFL